MVRSKEEEEEESLFYDLYPNSVAKCLPSCMSLTKSPWCYKFQSAHAQAICILGNKCRAHVLKQLNVRVSSLDSGAKNVNLGCKQQRVKKKCLHIEIEHLSLMSRLFP